MSERRSHPRIVTSARLRWTSGEQSKSHPLRDVGIGGTCVAGALNGAIGDDARFDLLDTSDRVVAIGIATIVWKRTYPPATGLAFRAVGIDRGLLARLDGLQLLGPTLRPPPGPPFPEAGGLGPAPLEKEPDRSTRVTAKEVPTQPPPPPHPSRADGGQPSTLPPPPRPSRLPTFEAPSPAEAEAEPATPAAPRVEPPPPSAAPAPYAPARTLPNSPIPDSALPDSPMPDSAMPDSAMPDSAMPDSTIPDSTVPPRGTPEGEAQIPSAAAPMRARRRDKTKEAPPPSVPPPETVRAPQAAVAAAEEKALAEAGAPNAQLGEATPLAPLEAPHDEGAMPAKAAVETVQKKPVPVVEVLDVPRPRLIIGIDLGTTNTCASYVVDGRPAVIPGRTGTSTIPSMITFDPDGSWHVGQRAADRQIMHPLRTVYGSKRLVGRTYRADVARDLQQHFAYPLAEADGQRFGARIGDRVISMDTVAARVLDEVRTSAEIFLGARVEAAVITVPAYFSEVQRDAVRRAAREANLVVHRIVNEPTAAAVAYGHKQKGKHSRVAVWDFGGGTFDFSVVELQDGEVKVLGTGGDNFVGGSDFDDLLASYLLSELRDEIGADFVPDPQQIARLRGAAETAKQALSTQTEAVVELREFTRDPKRSFSLEISRSGFEELARPLIARTVDIAREVLLASKLDPVADIDDVVLVGGSTRVPAVEAAVAELFQRKPSKRINPDEAVALGAALIGDEIASGTAPTLLDILPMSVGRGVPGLVFQTLVPRNVRLPARAVLELPADLLGTVALPLFQGESADVSRNEYLCSVVVEDRSLWDGGRVRLSLSFDEHCVMAVEAVDATTRAPLPVRLDRTRPLEDVLRDLGKVTPVEEPEPKPATSLLGGVLSKLFRVFR